MELLLFDIFLDNAFGICYNEFNILFYDFYEGTGLWDLYNTVVKDAAAILNALVIITCADSAATNG